MFQIIIWARKTNILGPKKIWVRKSITSVNDIGAHQDPKIKGAVVP